MSATDGLAEWLLDQIAEDELIANRYVDHLMAGGKRGFAFEDLALPVRRQVLEWSPGRVLAECEAKRRIIDHHRIEVEMRWVHDPDGPDHQEPEYSCAVCGWTAGPGCEIVRLLALPYADRPGYREEWRP